MQHNSRIKIRKQVKFGKKGFELEATMPIILILIIALILIMIGVYYFFISKADLSEIRFFK